MSEDRIPSYQELMRPVLETCGDEPKQISQIVADISDRLKLTAEERHFRLPRAKQTLIANRVHWARSYLKHAGLVENPQRGWVKLTSLGQAARQSTATIDNGYLRQFDDFAEFLNRTSAPVPVVTADVGSDTSTPDEDIARAYKRLRKFLASDLLDRTIANTPAFFEELLIKLFIAMGYGSSHENAGRSLGQSGDRGVDGVIDQDALGVDQIYLQAERYDRANKIGAHEIRDFYGALNLRRASKGVFVTTSDFTAAAEKTAQDLGARIVLINGQTLTELMIDHGVGVRDRETFKLYDLDEEFFASD